MNRLIETLKIEVQSHAVLNHPWLVSRAQSMTRSDLILWLSQEYFVSIGFVDWFLIVASKTKNQKAKIVLIENIWEELGEGNIHETHVSILEEFLGKLNFDLKSNKKLHHTESYLKAMKKIINKGFFYGLGALGPANEYLLKLEYSKISNSYQKLKELENLPEGKFFQVNLDADEGHSKRMFDLIEEVSLSEKEQMEVIEGNRLALNAREQFYIGLSIKH